MGLVKDGLYEEHKRLLAGKDLEKEITDYANLDSDCAYDVIDVLNIAKTSNVLGYSYTQFLEAVQENYSDKLTPPEDVVMAIMMSHIGDVPRGPKETINSYSVEAPPVESWDEYYYNVAKQVARNSKCLSRRIGAILVKNKLIVATGYNGPPKGIMRCDHRTDLIAKGAELEHKVCPRRTMGYKSGQGLEICIAAHAEANTINMCAMEGIKTSGATMYMTCGVPCKECMIKIIQVGIKELVVTSMEIYDEVSQWLLENSDVKIRLYDFI